MSIGAKRAGAVFGYKRVTRTESKRNWKALRLRLRGSILISKKTSRPLTEITELVDSRTCQLVMEIYTRVTEWGPKNLDSALYLSALPGFFIEAGIGAPDSS